MRDSQALSGPISPAAASIAACVRDCAKARDDRGRWRQQRACAAQLEQQGTSPAIAQATAQAAKNLGVWLKERTA